MATTRGRSRPISGIAIFRTRRAIPPWRRGGLRSFSGLSRPQAIILVGWYLCNLLLPPLLGSRCVHQHEGSLGNLSSDRTRFDFQGICSRIGYGEGAPSGCDLAKSVNHDWPQSAPQCWLGVLLVAAIDIALPGECTAISSKFREKPSSRLLVPVHPHLPSSCGRGRNIAS